MNDRIRIHNQTQEPTTPVCRKDKWWHSNENISKHLDTLHFWPQSLSVWLRATSEIHFGQVLTGDVIQSDSLEGLTEVWQQDIVSNDIDQSSL